MIKKTISAALLSLGLLLGVGLGHAEDIDIYSANTSVAPGAPNVLIVLDNTANWSQSFSGGTKFSAELPALYQVVNALKTQFRLGLMMFTETGSPNSGPDGGYVRFAIQDMTNLSGGPTAARNCLLQMVGGSAATCSNPYYSLLNIGANPGDKSNGGKIGITMGEVYDYFAGLTAYAGDNKVKADPLAFTSGTIAGPTYQSPVATGSCQKNFIIVISNGAFQDNTSDTSTAMTQLGAAGGNTTVINPPDTTSNNNAGDEWTRFLNKVSTVNAVTYTLEVGPSTTGQGPYNTSLLKSMGNQGKGGYYSAIDASTLNAALMQIFNDINAVNSVFASSSLPLSADNSGAYANQVYMGVFRPDAQGRPRWVGNLKQYQFSADSNGTLTLVDALGNPAAGSSGFAQPNAQSFWTSQNLSTAPDAPTPTGTGGFWFFDPKGTGGTYDLPDGEWVEKGAAAQQLRLTYLGYSGIKGINDSTAPRKVYTCAGGCASSGTALSATPFNTSNAAITDAVLGTANVSVTSITSASPETISSLVAGTGLVISQITNPSGSTIQVTTLLSHGYLTGDTVTIQGTGSVYDGTWSSITVTGSTTFTFTKSAGSKPTVNPAPGGSLSFKNSTNATVQTASTHGFVAGQRITIGGAVPSGFDGIVTVTNVTDTTHFTYTLATALGGTATTSGTATSNTATVVAPSHGLTTGQSATISGATPSGYNGVRAVTVVDANTFTYVYSVAAPLAAASGTITASVGGGRTTLINWVRGLDTQDENGDGRPTDVRASIHGDVLHSRPLVLNYGTPLTANNVYVFYGGNDGVFRAIKGGQAATDGVEQWAFIPQEFFGRLKRLYDNSPTVLYPSTPSSLTPKPSGTCDPTVSSCAQKRDYFWDGPVGSYVKRDSTGAISKAVLFLATRRGGRFIYALDVTTPTNPLFLWKQGCPDLGDDTGCTAGFSEMGEAWSQPQVMTVTANTNPVLIFGAGYDAASEDTEPPAATDLKGRAIYVLDALTGNLLWSAGAGTSVPVTGMDFSIAADVITMDRSLDGYADRVYAADVGGNVWRIDIADSSVSNWKVWKIATLASRSATASTRKFAFSPDVVFGSAFDAVVIGSGDREHPLASNGAYNVINRVYMLKDPNTGTTGAALGLTDTCGSSISTACTDLYNTALGTSVPPTANGWLMTLMTGEKVVNGPVVLAGNLIFGTNQPCASGFLNDNGTCSTSNAGSLTCTGNLGVARRYDISYLDSSSTLYTDSTGAYVPSQIAVGGGFLPSPVAGVVEIAGKNYIFVTDNPLNPGGVIHPIINVSKKRFRDYWKEKLE